VKTSKSNQPIATLPKINKDKTKQTKTNPGLFEEDSHTRQQVCSGKPKSKQPNFLVLYLLD
jgi:hypothetical protein